MARLPKHDPTRTGAIERRWFREIRERWNRYSKTTLDALPNYGTEVSFPLAVGAGGLAFANQDDPFVMSVEQRRTYMAFVERQIQELLLGTEEPPNWQAQYQLQSYNQSLEQIRAQLIAEGARIEPTVAERLAAEGLEPFNVSPSLSTGPAAQTVHQESLEFLFTRSYDRLKGWTDALAVQTREILFEGVQQGLNSRDIAAQIQARIDVSESSARRIAQTETNQAFSRAAITEIERASAETGEQIDTRWITSRDDVVRHSHAIHHGQVMTTDRAAQIKRDDGINCRCSLVAVVPGTNTRKRQARFDAERTALLALERD